MAHSTTLRSLAKSYATGQIEKDYYRRKRAEFLEDILDGDVLLQDTISEKQPLNFNSTYSRMNLRKEELDAAVSRYKKYFNKQKKSQNSYISKQSIFISGVVICILLVVAIVYITGTQNQQADTRNILDDAPPSAAQNLILSFIEQNNWGQSNLDAFLMDWRAIDASERSSASTSTEYIRLINAIYKKLLEERALSRIGNPETAYEKQRQLIVFATNIGINDQRISLPDELPDINQ